MFFLQQNSSGGAFQAFTGMTTSKPDGSPAFLFGNVTNKSFSSLTPVSSASVVPTTDSVSLGNVNSLSKSLGVTHSSTVSSSPTATFSFVSKVQPFVPVATSQNSSKESSAKTGAVMSTVPGVDKNSKQQESKLVELC